MAAELGVIAAATAVQDLKCTSMFFKRLVWVGVAFASERKIQMNK